jgi:hypothetical protein
VPSAYTNLADPTAKVREVVCVQMSHRRSTAYLYTKGVKEEFLAKSPDSILCVEDTFLTRMIQAKVLSKTEFIIELTGSLHKRDGMVLYQALHTIKTGPSIQGNNASASSSTSSSLLFHIRVPYANNNAAFMQLLHSGITTLPVTQKDANKATRESKPSSLVFPVKHEYQGKSPISAATASSSSSIASSSATASKAPPAAASSSSAPTTTHAAGHPPLDRSTSDPSLPNAIGDDAQKQQQNVDVEILTNLPPYLANAKPIQFLPHSQKLIDIPTPAKVSLPPNPYPYVTSETQILRGRDRASEEETDRYTALYYMILIFSRLNKP